jgi:hypothetical protein
MMQLARLVIPANTPSTPTEEATSKLEQSKGNLREATSKLEPIGGFVLPARFQPVAEVLEACNLHDNVPSAVTWCNEQGVDSMAMLLELKLENALADALSLKPAKRQQLLKRLAESGHKPATPASPTSPLAKPVVATKNGALPPKKGSSPLKKGSKTASSVAPAPAHSSAMVRVQEEKEEEPEPLSPMGGVRASWTFGSREKKPETPDVRDAGRDARVSAFFESLGFSDPSPLEAAMTGDARAPKGSGSGSRSGSPVPGTPRPASPKVAKIGWGVARRKAHVAMAVGSLDEAANKPALQRSQADLDAEKLYRTFVKPKREADEGPSEYDLDVLHYQTMALLDYVQTVKEQSSSRWAAESKKDSHLLEEKKVLMEELSAAILDHLTVKTDFGEVPYLKPGTSVEGTLETLATLARTDRSALSDELKKFGFSNLRKLSKVEEFLLEMAGETKDLFKEEAAAKAIAEAEAAEKAAEEAAEAAVRAKSKAEAAQAEARAGAEAKAAELKAKEEAAVRAEAEAAEAAAEEAAMAAARAKAKSEAAQAAFRAKDEAAQAATRAKAEADAKAKAPIYRCSIEPPLPFDIAAQVEKVLSAAVGEKVAVRWHADG